MTDEQELKCSITKRETKRAANGMVLEEKYLSVEAKDITEAEMVFERKWQ